MSNVVFRSNEQVVHQQSADLQHKWSHQTSVECIITDQRLIVGSYRKPTSGVKGAVASAIAKGIGPVAELAMLGNSLVQAGLDGTSDKSSKPLYLISEQSLECLTQIITWGWGFAGGVIAVLPDGEKLKLRLGAKQTRDNWVATLKQTVEQYCPHILVSQSEKGLAFMCRQGRGASSVNGRTALKTAFVNDWELNSRGVILSFHRRLHGNQNIRYELREAGRVRDTRNYVVGKYAERPGNLIADVFPKDPDYEPFIIRASIHEDGSLQRDPVLGEQFSGRWFRLSVKPKGGAGCMNLKSPP